jgi:hypothetical protein
MKGIIEGAIGRGGLRSKVILMRGKKYIVIHQK